MPKREMPLVGLYTGTLGSTAFQAAHWLANQWDEESSPVAWLCAAHPALPCGHTQQVQTPGGYPVIFYGTSSDADETAQAAFECLTTLTGQVLHAIVPLAEAFIPAFVAAYQQWPLILTPYPWSEQPKEPLTQQWVLAHTSVLAISQQGSENDPPSEQKKSERPYPPWRMIEWENQVAWHQLYCEMGR